MTEKIREQLLGLINDPHYNPLKREELALIFNIHPSEMPMFYNFLDELKTKDYDNVLIVAHSGVSKAFSGYFEGIQDGKFLNRGLKNCEIKEYKL